MHLALSKDETELLREGLKARGLSSQSPFELSAQDRAVLDLYERLGASE